MITHYKGHKSVSDREIYTKEERIARTMERQSVTTKPTNRLTEYLQRENVKRYNAVLIDKALIKNCESGRELFKNEKLLKEEVIDYFKLCYDNDIVPNVQNLCTYLGLQRDKLYTNSYRTDNVGYILSNALELCHSNIVNGTIEGNINSVLYMFLSKNWHSMKDNTTINLTTPLLEQGNANETLNIVKEQLELENKDK